MKIGIDAKWYFEGNPSGKVVVSNIIEKIVEQKESHEYFIILRKQDKDKIFPYSAANIRLLYVWGRINQLSNIFCIPFVINKYKLDSMLFFLFSPLFVNTKKVVFIFDAIFKSNPEYFSLWERIYFMPIRYLANKADKILTISKSEKERLIKYQFGKRKNIEVVYLGINSKYEKSVRDTHADNYNRIRNRYKLPDRYLLYIGRINVRKNIPNLLRAVSYLKDENIKMVLGGKCDWKTFNLPQLIKTLGLEQRVITTGYIKDEDLPVIYSLATLFCYVSYDEGFGLPPLESLASGVPVVVADTGSLPEICGDAGIYCDPRDPLDIAEKIDLLLKNPELYKEKRDIGLEISKKYTWTNSTKRIMEIIENI